MSCFVVTPLIAKSVCFQARADPWPRFCQTLIVTSGLGWAQAEGAPIEEIRPGDVVRFPPGLKH